MTELRPCPNCGTLCELTEHPIFSYTSYIICEKCEKMYYIYPFCGSSDAEPHDFRDGLKRNKVME